MFNGFIRRGSRFRGPQRTEYQTHNMTRLTTPRRSVQFERRPSQRFSRRASYAAKRQKNQEVRQQPVTTENAKSDLINICEDKIEAQYIARGSKQSPKSEQKV